MLKNLTLSFLIVALLSAVSMIWIDWSLAFFIKAHAPDVFVRLSHLGRPFSLVPILFLPLGLILSLIKPKMPKIQHLSIPWITIGSSVLVGDILTRVVKMTIGRYRPIAYFNEGLAGFNPMHVMNAGFPSGSTTRIMATIVGLWLFFPKHRGLWVAIGVFVVASRLLTQAHFLSDVIMGAWIGTAVACGLYALSQKAPH